MDGGANIARLSARWPEGGAQRTRPKGERGEGASHAAARTVQYSKRVLTVPGIAASCSRNVSDWATGAETSITT